MSTLDLELLTLRVLEAVFLIMGGKDGGSPWAKGCGMRPCGRSLCSMDTQAHTGTHVGTHVHSPAPCLSAMRRRTLPKASRHHQVGLEEKQRGGRGLARKGTGMRGEQSSG